MSARSLRGIAAAAIVCCSLGVASRVHAHAFAPSLLALQETADGTVAVTWKTPRLRVMGSDVRPRLPAHCGEATSPVVEEGETAVTLRWNVSCGAAGLVGGRVAIDGLASANTNGFVRVVLADGRLIQQVVTSAAPFLTIPAPLARSDVWFEYTKSGMRHIVERPDRILFLLGLFLLAPTTLLMLQTLIAFTIGHSVTLSAALFGLIAIPSRAIEFVLAATILTLATELAREPSRTLMRRFPWAMGFAFGLAHGLGFAAVLQQGTLPAVDLPLAVLSFNTGIEVGQLIVVSVLVAVTYTFRRLPTALPRWTRQVPIYVMGSLAAFWCFERAAALLR